MTNPPTQREIRSFLSRAQLRALASRESEGSAPARECGFGASLFVDVVGFTPLAESLALEGARGAERLSEIIDECFGRLTDVVLSAGGDLVVFAGDAAIAVWPAGPQRDLVESTCLAADAALTVQRVLDERLPLRASVGAGSLDLSIVGGIAGRWSFLAGGEAILQAMRTDRTCAAGEVRLSREAWDVAGDRFRSSSIDADAVRIEAVVRPAAAAPVEDEPAPLPVDLLRGSVPRIVAERIAAGHGGWIAEFRSVSLVFVNLTDTRTGAALLELGPLHDAVGAMQREVDRLEGTVYQLLLDDKGTTLVAAFGLPLLAHEDDTVRAARAAIEMERRLESLGVRASLGIASGRVWCGVYGTPARRQYTIVGSTVNRAARLMTAAEGDVLCDQATSERLAGSIRAEPLPPIRVKGLASPIPVFRPAVATATEARPPRPQATPLVGRMGEIETLRRALADSGDRSATFLIEGAAGIGKTRLVEEFAAEARRAGARVLTGRGEALESGSPYAPWRAILRDVLGIDSQASDPDRRRGVVLERLRGRAGREGLAPLLNAILPLEFAETDATRRLSPEVRAERRHALVVELLAEARAASATVLILEDAHWFDSASRSLALRVAHRIPGLIVVLTARPADPPNEALAELPQRETTRLRLDPLSADETAAVVRDRLGVDELPRLLAELIRAQAGGHPFFAEQLALALRDAGAFRVEARRCVVRGSIEDAGSSLASAIGDVPRTIESAILGRVDRLPPSQQITLKVASVLGRAFPEAALHGVHPSGADAASSDLAAILDGELVRVESEALPATYAFDQALVQEVVYGSIPFAQRRTLHRSAAEWYERGGAPAPESWSVLAHHWKGAEAPARASDYFARAGRHSLDQYSNAEAIRFLQEALELDATPRATSSSASAREARFRRGTWRLQLGRAYVNASRHREGGPQLERGLRALGQPVPEGVAGTMLGLIGQSGRQMLRRLRGGRDPRAGTEAAARLLQIARGYEGLVEVRYLDDAKLGCVHAALCALNVAERAGPSAELARGYASLGALMGFMKAHSAAEAYLRRSLEVADRVHDVEARAWGLLSAGVYAAGLGRWGDATERLREAASISTEIEDARRADDARLALATVLVLRGDLDGALALADECHASADRRSDWRCRAGAVRIRTACLAIRGQNAGLDDCAREFEAHLDPARETRPGDRVGASALLAWCALRRGDLGAAETHLGPAIAGLAKLGSFFPLLIEYTALAEVALALGERGGPARDAVARLLRSHARAFPTGASARAWFDGRRHAIAGREGRARACWREGARAAAEMGMPIDEARCRQELARHAVDLEERDEQRRRGRELRAKLGAVDSPPGGVERD